MEELDGNGAAGLLLEVFGTEMTRASVTCGSCGTVAPIGESALYPGGPGTVIRCRACASALMVITQIRGMRCLDLMGIGAMDMPPGQYRFGSQADGSWVWSDGHSVRGEDGSLASSMHGMDRMVRTMAKAIEQDLPAVIRMASLTPAELTGIAGEVGSLAPGKRADIVVLDGDFEVERVFIAGAPLPVADARPDQAA